MTKRTPPGNLILLCIQHIPTRGLVDTGASVSLLKADFLRKHGIKIPASPRQQFQSVTSALFTTRGPINMDVKIGGLTIPFNFYVSEDVPQDCLLGFDFLQASNAKIFTNTNTLTLFDDLTAVKMAAYDSEVAVALVSNVSIPPRSEAVLAVRTTGKQPSGTYMIEQNPQVMHNTLWVARALVNTNATNMPCRVLNPTDKPIKLRKGTQLGYLSSVTQLDSHTPDKEVRITDEQLAQMTHEEKIQILDKKGVSLEGTALAGSD